jgi:hypothetical protein
MAVTLDHIVLATRNLKKACAAFQRLTGIMPSLGGSHVGRGTANYLCALGGDVYLEIVGIDPEQDVDKIVVEGGPQAVPFGIFSMGPEECKVLTFSCAVNGGTNHLSDAARTASWLADPIEMSRKTPSGELLEWSLALPKENNNEYPFLIDWTEVNRLGLHPSKTSTEGCRLVSLDVEVQDPSSYKDDLNNAGIGHGLFEENLVCVKQRIESPSNRLVMVLETPNGTLSLSDNLLSAGIFC